MEIIAKLGLKIAAKSGTAQENTNEPDHSLLVTYSPYDDPQICVSVCIQHGYSSTTSMDLTADVYKIYYGMRNNYLSKIKKKILIWK